MLDLTGSLETASSGTAMVTINNIAMACGNTLSGILTAVCAETVVRSTLDRARDQHSPDVPRRAIPLHGHVAGTLRLGVVNPRHGSGPTKDVIRYMTSTSYGNVRQTILMPTQVVVQLPQSYRPRSGTNRKQEE